MNSLFRSFCCQQHRVAHKRQRASSHFTTLFPLAAAAVTLDVMAALTTKDIGLVKLLKGPSSSFPRFLCPDIRRSSRRTGSTRTTHCSILTMLQHLSWILGVMCVTGKEWSWQKPLANQIHGCEGRPAGWFYSTRSTCLFPFKTIKHCRISSPKDVSHHFTVFENNPKCLIRIFTSKVIVKWDFLSYFQTCLRQKI